MKGQNQKEVTSGKIYDKCSSLFYTQNQYTVSSENSHTNNRIHHSVT